MNNSFLLGEFIVASGTSTLLASSFDISPLITALITFGTTLVTMVGGELIKFLVNYFKNKAKKYEDNEKKEK